MSSIVNKRGRPKNPPKARELLKNIIPIKEMFTDDEVEIYEALVDVYLNDFEDDLTANDVDDVMTLSMNKVLEIRLLKHGKDNTDIQIDISSALEKLRKETGKLKENLSSRRRDRIDPNKYKGFSIVDLAAAYEDNKKLELQERVEQQKKEKSDILLSRERMGYVGNREDKEVIDAKEE
jgi:hypothetical protein